MIACQKSSNNILDTSEQESPELRTDSIDVEYRLNQSQTSKFTPDPLDTTYYTLIEGIQSKNGEDSLIIIHKFTNEQDYFSYGDSIGVNLKLYHAINDSIAFIADSLNMDSISTQLGEIPDWWKNIESSIRSNMIAEELDTYAPSNMKNSINKNNDQRVEMRATLTQINDHQFYPCSSNDRERTIISLSNVGIPNMWFLGWCDDPSSFEPIGIFGVDFVYNRSWYRGLTGVFVNWGFTRISFCRDLHRFNNIACSWSSFGI